MTDSQLNAESSLSHCPNCGATVGNNELSLCPSCGESLRPGLQVHTPDQSPAEGPSDPLLTADYAEQAGNPDPLADLPNQAGNLHAEDPFRMSTNGIGHPDAFPWDQKDPGGLDRPLRPSATPAPAEVPPTPNKVHSPARNQMAAALIAAALAVAVFTGILLWLRNSSKPAPVDVAAGVQNPVTPGVIGTGSSQSPGMVSPGSIQTNGSAGSDPAATTDSPLQIYWRPATAEYFTEHPSVPTSSIRIPDGYSASLVRVDIENTGSAPIAIQAGAFLLTAPGAYASLAHQKLPGSLTSSTVNAHGSVRGWLLFVKPWWDISSDGQQVMVRLVYSAPPGAHVNLSNHAPARPIPVPSAASGRWTPRENEPTYSV